MNRFARTVRFAVLLACVAFLFSGLAHAGHFHKKTPQPGHDEAVCQLCLQFDRSAPPPSPATLVAPSVLLTRVLLPAGVVASVESLSQPYQARAPPVS
ncbi:MAG: hypothetical protein WDO56_03215 [Gammaproteobacteria bacterium]